MQERRASAADKSPLEMASVSNKLELLLQSSYVFLNQRIIMIYPFKYKKNKKLAPE